MCECINVSINGVNGLIRCVWQAGEEFTDVFQIHRDNNNNEIIMNNNIMY